MPTTSNRFSPGVSMICPTACPPGQKCCAAAALRIATPGLAAVSRASKNLPATSDPPSASRYPGLTLSTPMSICRPASPAGRMTVPRPAPSGLAPIPAATTPGSARTRDTSSRSDDTAPACAKSWLEPESPTLSVRLGLNPSGSAPTARTVRTRSPAATTSTSARAISVMARTCRTRRPANPASTPPESRHTGPSVSGDRQARDETASEADGEAHAEREDEDTEVD